MSPPPITSSSVINLDQLAIQIRIRNSRPVLWHKGDGVSSKNYRHLKEAKSPSKKPFPIYQYFISCHAQALLLLVLFSSKMKYVMLSCFSPSFRVCLSHLLCQRQRLEGPVRPPWAEDSTRGKCYFAEDFGFFFWFLPWSVWDMWRLYK